MPRDEVLRVARDGELHVLQAKRAETGEAQFPGRVRLALRETSASRMDERSSRMRSRLVMRGEFSPKRMDRDLSAGNSCRRDKACDSCGRIPALFSRSKTLSSEGFSYR